MNTGEKNPELSFHTRPGTASLVRNHELGYAQVQVSRFRFLKVEDG